MNSFELNEWPIYDVFACRFDHAVLVEDLRTIPTETRERSIDGTYIAVIAPYYVKEGLYALSLTGSTGNCEDPIYLHDPYQCTLAVLFHLPDPNVLPARIKVHARGLDGLRWGMEVLPPAVGPTGDLAIATLARYDSQYIEEWMAYHAKIGVGHFFIYVNQSPELATVLQNSPMREQITVIPWDYSHCVRPYQAYPRMPRDSHLYSQPVQQTHALRKWGHNWRWMALIDCDEFLVPATTVLAALPEDVDYVSVPAKWFGNSCRREFTSPVLQSYTRCESGCTSYPKIIARPQAVQTALIHWCEARRQPTAPLDESVLRINHYRSIGKQWNRTGSQYDREYTNATEDRRIWPVAGIQ